MPPEASPAAPACAFMRELLRLLDGSGKSGSKSGADHLFLSLLMLELRALTCGAPDATLQAIGTARTTAGFASLGGLSGIARPA
ncbi:hypothetical protein [Methylobacterium durans]|uniref:Uncharacterized protein n=1 Tax=Methylobacterium durans TaxID=2202825 RepID=A0A2U8WC50_9HYPH|nr:hypothetical protein [Methylobacterium durans]AWN43735.1 hypothetical protein DK389_28495 [Methylobacterium durans]